MRTMQEIKTDIEALSPREHRKLLVWLAEKDWSAWDSELEHDASAGKLDFLVDEAQRELVTHGVERG